MAAAVCYALQRTWADAPPNEQRSAAYTHRAQRITVEMVMIHDVTASLSLRVVLRRKSSLEVWGAPVGRDSRIRARDMCEGKELRR